MVTLVILSSQISRRVPSVPFHSRLAQLESKARIRLPWFSTRTWMCGTVCAPSIATMVVEKMTLMRGFRSRRDMYTRYEAMLAA